MEKRSRRGIEILSINSPAPSFFGSWALLLLKLASPCLTAPLSPPSQASSWAPSSLFDSSFPSSSFFNSSPPVPYFYNSWLLLLLKVASPFWLLLRLRLLLSLTSLLCLLLSSTPLLLLSSTPLLQLLLSLIPGPSSSSR